mgnify:CR=1 FL=1
MSKHDNSQQGLPRREFLRRSATLVGAAGAGLAMAGAHAGGDAPGTAADRPEGAKGYRESEHVKRYYRMADF